MEQAELREVEASFVPERSKSQPGRTCTRGLQRKHSHASSTVLPPELSDTLPSELLDILGHFFDQMDVDGGGSISKQEAVAFWGRNSAKANTMSLFGQVDSDRDEQITWSELVRFFGKVLSSGNMTAEQLCIEIQSMAQGGD